MNKPVNSDPPVVSVVIPCYNGEKYVSEAIESVLAQTVGPVEVVVVDDGSSDNSVAVVERYTGGTNVRLIRHPENRGIAAARNTGVRASRACYIGFLDQDDLWHEDKLRYQLPALENDQSGEIGVVFSNITFVDERRTGPVLQPNKAPRGVHRFGHDELIASLFLKNYVQIGATLTRRECFDTVGYLDETIRSGSDDFEFLVRVAGRYRFSHVDRPLFLRRLHEANYTNPELMVPDALKIIDRVTAKHPAVKPAADRARGRLLYHLARDLHCKKQYSRARLVYVDAIRARPLNPRPAAGLLLCLLGRAGDVVLSVFRGK
jgi:glycosyltransferase involved in cell wall biosynthesis